MKSFLIKNTRTILPLILVLQLALPLSVFAQQAQYDTTGAPRAIVVDENSQAATALNGGSSGSVGLSANAATQSMASCLAASGLTNVVKRQISSMVDNMLGSIADSRVPTGNSVIEGKETGTMASAYISWDQMGYCMVNSLIEAIGKATVNWINSGFQGNPVFVDDPEQFFTDIADIEAGRFLGDISNGFLCAPIKNIVRVNLATSYNSQNSSFNNRNQCTFTGVAGNIEQFMSGETFSWDDWLSYTQNPSNNPIGATLYGNIELDRRIAQSLGTQSKLLEWGRGFLSFKDPETGKISSPGTVIEGQINQRLFNGESRISMADEFDEVVTALVNQLVKIAVNEITSSN